MASVALIYGFAEGHWVSGRFRAALQRAGFSLAKSPAEADIIVAHSGGCYMLPDESRANVVMLVDLPHWPDKHIGRSLAQKTRNDIKDLWAVKTAVLNSFYLIAKPRQWSRMRRAIKKLENLPSRDNDDVILVRNSRSHFLHPTAAKELAKTKKWRMQVMDGHHDDLWKNPAPYIKLLKEMTR